MTDTDLIRSERSPTFPLVASPHHNNPDNHPTQVFTTYIFLLLASLPTAALAMEETTVTSTMPKRRRRKPDEESIAKKVRLQLAIETYQSGQCTKSFRKLAAEFGVSRTTLQARLKGRSPKGNFRATAEGDIDPALRSQPVIDTDGGAISLIEFQTPLSANYGQCQFVSRKTGQRCSCSQGEFDIPKDDGPIDVASVRCEDCGHPFTEHEPPRPPPVQPQEEPGVAKIKKRRKQRKAVSGARGPDKANRLELAVKAYEDFNGTKSFRKIAEEFTVSRTTLRARIAGRRSMKQLHADRQMLTPEEEESVKESIEKLQSWKWPDRVAQVKNLAQDLLSKRMDDPPEIGSNWVGRFLSRHPHLKEQFSCPKNEQRENGFNLYPGQT